MVASRADFSLLLNGERIIAEAQTAMIEYGESQCGYCTPGFVIGMVEAQSNGDRDVHSLGGNLCRCTGMLPLRLPNLVSRLATLAECFELMRSDPEATFVAGNTDYGIETNLRDRRSTVLPGLSSDGACAGRGAGRSAWHCHRRRAGDANAHR
ncbi:MAG: 2Fe-2S iron-sulfur cluster-binding protein [Terriglobia bacterium]